MNDPQKMVPRIMMSFAAWQRIMGFTMAAPTHEVAGFAYVEVRGNALYIDRPFILKQTVGLHGADTDALALAELISKLSMETQGPIGLNFQWHSHVDAGAYFSPTDMQSISKTTGDWLISMVVNRRGDMCCRFDTFNPTWFGMEVRVVIDYSNMDPQQALYCEEQVKQHVKVRHNFRPAEETGEMPYGPPNPRLLGSGRDLRPRRLWLARARRWPWWHR